MGVDEGLMALLLYIILNLVINYVPQCFLFLFLSGVPAWRLINVSVHHNGGFLPGVILLTQRYYC